MSKFFFVLLLVLAVSLVQAGVVRSFGSGPAFEISPGIVIAGPDGHFQVGGFSEDGSPITLSAYFNGETKSTVDKQWTFTFTLPSTMSYAYITFESRSGYLTSFATALVISYNLQKTDSDVYFYPSYNGYMRGDEHIYVIAQPGYGRESLSILVDDNRIFEWQISPFDNSPKVFGFNFDTKNLKDGFHLFSTRENLVTGQSLSSNAYIGIDNNGPKVVSFIGKDIFLSGKYEITVKATGAIPLKDISLYVKNGNESTLLSTLPANKETKFIINEFAGSKTFEVNVSDVSGMSRVYSFVVQNNQSFVIPLVILAFTLGVIFLTFLK
ncbi:hypothetical protein [Athalassotoga saccharophila]|uniref:hypothetical protein n=1 Tax=Athalassotoga saccharophila TaxID=1441386 RepID=UPI00137AB375|nr:hypothetical protein [Athalassotoga saccharophila]BBJ28212.1 hypothetical protein ATHSA_1114 [Athalassotoga saccharophila]